MNDDGARKSFNLYPVRVWRGAGDLIICGLAAVGFKHSGCALAIVNGNPCGLGFKVKEEIRFHGVALVEICAGYGAGKFAAGGVSDSLCAVV